MLSVAVLCLGLIPGAAARDAGSANHASIRLSADGQLQWQVTLGGSANDQRGEQGEPALWRLAADGQPLVLQFSVPSQPSMPRYHYQLLGADPGWYALPEGISTLQFAHLSAGHYRFIMRTSTEATPPSEQILLDIWIGDGVPRTSLWIPLVVMLGVFAGWMGYRRYQQRAAARGQFATASLNIQTELQQLRSESEGRRQFLYRLAEELRESLLLLSTSATDPRHMTAAAASEAQSLDRGVARLQGLIGQFIAVCHAGQVTAQNLQPLILRSWLTPRLEQYRLQVEAKQIGWVMPMLPDVVISVDSALLDEVLRISIGQLLELSLPGGEMQLSLSLDEEKHQLVWQARCTSLPQAVIENWAQLPAEGEQSQRSGHWARHMLWQRIQASGGCVLSSSVIGAAQWHLTLPCQWTSLANTGSGAVMPTMSPDKAPTLLLIEDDPDLQQLLWTWLGNDYRMVISSSIRGGLLSAREMMPDLILCDQQLPDGDANQLLEELKFATDTSHIPIIICSVLTDDLSRRRAWHQTADDYIQKPFDPESLRLRLQALLQNRDRLQHWLQQSLSMRREGEDVRVPQQAEIAGLPPGELAFGERLRSISYELLRQDRLSVEHLAEHFNISSRSLQRKLSSLFGMSYSDYVRELQLQLVVEQLRCGASIKSAAAMAGFRDQAYLTRVFKQQFGVTPSQYKKQLSAT